MKNLFKQIALFLLMLLMTLPALGIGTEHFHFITTKFPGNEKFFLLGMIYLFFFIKLAIEGTQIFSTLKESKNYKRCEIFHYGILLLMPLHEFVCEPLNACGIDYALLMFIMVFFPEHIWKVISEMMESVRVFFEENEEID